MTQKPAYGSYTASVTDELLAEKQNKLTAGTGINIDEATNTISSDGLSEIAWGDITGTLANQTDLQAALDSKADASLVEASSKLMPITSSMLIDGKVTLEHNLNSEAVTVSVYSEDKTLIISDDIKINNANEIEVNLSTFEVTGIWSVVIQGGSLSSSPSEDVYTKAETNTLLNTKQDTLTAGTNITIEGNVISSTSGSSNPEWGSIEGTLANQTDLQAALDNKANTSDIPDVSNFVTDAELTTALDTKQDELTFDTTPTTNSTNPVTSGGVKSYVDSKVSSVYTFKGSVASYSNLPTENITVGDVYDVTDTGMNYAWTGTEWDELGSNIDLSNYYTKTETNDLLNDKQDALTTEQLDNISDIPNKQDKLTAGTGIDITGNVISNTNTESVWGDITGTLADQTDLQTALDNKADASDIPDVSNFVTDTELTTALDTKQDKLTAGTGIDITGNVISNTQTSAEWGNITGTLADQTDLQSALDSKANTSDIPDISNFVTDTELATALDAKQDELTFDSIPTADSTNPVTSGGIKSYVDSKVAGIYTFKGAVASYSNLPTENITVGDVYDVTDTGMNYAWTGTEWDELGSNIDLSNYYTKTETNDLLDNKANTSDIPDVSNFVTDAELTTSLETKQDKLTAGNGITISDTDVISASSSSTTGIINESTLTEGVSVITHNLGSESITVTVYDNTKSVIVPDEIRIIDSNQISINVSSFVVTGNWIVVVQGGAFNGDSTNTYTKSETNTLLSAKQDKLTAGTGIDITNNVISNTQTSAEWGNIEGTLANQTDLQAALDGKANTSDIPDVSNFVTDTELTTSLEAKQDTLTAGTGIDITNNVISNTNTSAEWGNITGTLANQTDLQAALDSKADASLVEASSKLMPVTSSMLIDGKVTLEHNLNSETVIVSVYNENKSQVIPDGITVKNSNEIEVDLTNLIVTGIWSVVIQGGSLSSSPSEDVYTKAETNTLLNTKQDELTAGTNITIEGNVISSTGGSSNAEWGSITGTLADQTDLQAALDNKQGTLIAGANITINGATNTISAANQSNTIIIPEPVFELISGQQIEPTEIFSSMEEFSNFATSLTQEGKYFQRYEDLSTLIQDVTTLPETGEPGVIYRQDGFLYSIWDGNRYVSGDDVYGSKNSTVILNTDSFIDESNSVRRISLTYIETPLYCKLLNTYGAADGYSYNNDMKIYELSISHYHENTYSVRKTELSLASTQYKKVSKLPTGVRTNGGDNPLNYNIVYLLTSDISDTYNQYMFDKNTPRKIILVPPSEDGNEGILPPVGDITAIYELQNYYRYYLWNSETNSYDEIYSDQLNEMLLLEGGWICLGSGSGGSSTTAWGDITGTLADQTDLQAALASKQNTLVAGSGISISDTNVISTTGTGPDNENNSFIVLNASLDAEGNPNYVSTDSTNINFNGSIKYITAEGETKEYSSIASIPLQDGHVMVNNGVGEVVQNIYVRDVEPVEPFIQPTLTSNGTWGGSSFATRLSSQYQTFQAYNVYDKKSNTYCHTNNTASLPQYIDTWLAQDVLLSGLHLTNRYDYEGSASIEQGNLYVTNDGDSWTLVKSFTNNVVLASEEWDVLLDSPVICKGFRIECTRSSGDKKYFTLGEIDIVAVTPPPQGSVWYNYLLNTSSRLNAASWTNYQGVPVALVTGGAAYNYRYGSWLGVDPVFAKANKETKEEVIGWGMPDYKAGVTIKLSTTPTAMPFRGRIVGFLNYNGTTLMVDGVAVSAAKASNIVDGTVIADVSEDNLVHISVAVPAGQQFLTLVPFKGAI